MFNSTASIVMSRTDAQNGLYCIIKMVWSRSNKSASSYSPQAYQLRFHSVLVLAHLDRMDLIKSWSVPLVVQEVLGDPVAQGDLGP